MLLNLLFNEFRLGNSAQPSVFAAKPIRYLTSDQARDLQDGDTFVGGKLVDCDGDEVPVVPVTKVEEVRHGIECGALTCTDEIAAIVALDTEHAEPAAPADPGRAAGDGSTGEDGARLT